MNGKYLSEVTEVFFVVVFFFLFFSRITTRCLGVFTNDGLYSSLESHVLELVFYHVFFSH